MPTGVAARRGQPQTSAPSSASRSREALEAGIDQVDRRQSGIVEVEEDRLMLQEVRRLPLSDEE